MRARILHGAAAFELLHTHRVAENNKGDAELYLLEHTRARIYHRRAQRV
jgi:hypothetical protein